MSTKKLKVNDRVKRVSVPGCTGIIKDIREETMVSAANVDNKDRSQMVAVQWDNGTVSMFAPESLEVVKGA